MSNSKIPPYILQELPDISDTVKYPIKNIQRIRYTCFDISRSLIAFGATSGGIYVFNRWPCEFVQLIPSKKIKEFTREPKNFNPSGQSCEHLASSSASHCDRIIYDTYCRWWWQHILNGKTCRSDGPITRLAISPDEKHIGFANGKGFLTVTECDQSQSNGYSSTSSKEHQGNEVTAMVWSRNMLFAGDDIGKVSVLQVKGFIAKTMFQSSSQTIMSLDSRICQLDSRNCMILVSTLTRCYICNTEQEQYRQIGQKLRDGEFGACFANVQKPHSNGAIENKEQDFTEVKKYNIVDDDARFIVGEEFANTVIFCARPSSRFWEATVDGMVQRTHQLKQVLAKHPMKVITLESYEKETYCIEDFSDDITGQSVNFSKIYSFNNTIFAYNKNAIYFLNFQNVDDTVWFDEYKDIVDCKLYNDMIYIWLASGSLISLKFMKLDRFLVKCYFDEKFLLCADLCTIFKDYLLSQNVSPKLNILVGLRDKLDNNGILKSVEGVLEKFDSLKSSDATQMNSGIYVLENTYHTQSLLHENVQMKQDENIFGPLTPEAMQALKGLSITVSDKLNTSKKMLKEKWKDLKHLSIEKQDVSQIRTIHENDKAPKWISRDEYTLDDAPIVLENDIIFKETSQEIVEVDNNVLEQDKICKMLYQYSRLSLVNTESELSNLNSIIESYACDISQIYDLMLLLEKYCISIGAVDEATFVPNNIFLTYLSNSDNKCALIDLIIKDEVLYKYFVDSCIAVNIKAQKHSNIGCECGFPLPYVRASQMPVFSELIDEFIEQQWSSQTEEQCYEVCRKMPYLWRKILYLRRNEDLINVLRILLQMLDETLLHSFLPQFTLDTWERAIQLYATLYANMCLNCNKKFEHISVRDMLSWDQLGLMIIKSVGGRNAVKVMQKHANLIEFGALTVKFYYTCLLAALYEKYDCTITIPLADTIYSSYEFEESRKEIHKLLQSISTGVLKNTALPLTVAATSPFWGLAEVYEKLTKDPQENLLSNDISMAMTVNNLTDCALCGLPLQNIVLIKDGGLWVFRCGHTFHGACLNLNQIKLCPSCSVK